MPRHKEPWRRERILDYALGLLAEGNTERLRISDVARAAGVSPASVHYHFGDLSGLVMAAIDKASDEMFRARQAVIEDIDDAADQLRALILLGVPDRASPALVMMYTATQLIRLDADAVTGGREHVESQVGLYENVIASGISQGLFVLTGQARAIAANLVALEDAFDLYLVLGLYPDGARGRSQLYSYVESALSYTL